MNIDKLIKFAFKEYRKIIGKYRKPLQTIIAIVFTIHFLKIFSIILIEDIIVLKFGATAWNWALKISVVILISLVIFMWTKKEVTN